MKDETCTRHALEVPLNAFCASPGNLTWSNIIWVFRYFIIPSKSPKLNLSAGCILRNPVVLHGYWHHVNESIPFLRMFAKHEQSWASSSGRPPPCFRTFHTKIYESLVVFSRWTLHFQYLKAANLRLHWSSAQMCMRTCPDFLGHTKLAIDVPQGCWWSKFFASLCVTVGYSSC